MQRLVNLRLVSYALLAVLALLATAYAFVHQLVAHAANGSLSMRECVNPAADAGDTHAAHFVSCGGFIE